MYFQYGLNGTECNDPGVTNRVIHFQNILSLNEVIIIRVLCDVNNLSDVYLDFFVSMMKKNKKTSRRHE